MKSTGNYFYMKKTELKQNYTQFPNVVLSLNITTIEKLILIYLFSNSEDFRITEYRIKETIGIDQRIVKKAMAKFKSIGFIKSINANTFTIDIDKLLEYNSIERCKSTTSKITTTSKSTTSKITPSSSNYTLIETCKSTPSSSKITPILVVDLLSNNTKQEEIKKETNNTNYNTKEILTFGFTEVSFNPIQLKNLNGVIKFFVTNYKLTEDQVKLFIIN